MNERTAPRPAGQSEHGQSEHGQTEPAAADLAAADLGETDRAAAQEGRDAPGPEGGDPVCWLHRVCPECGAFADTAPPTVCHRCGTRFGD